MERNELCWCGSGKKYKKCHLMIEEKIAYHADKGEIVPTRDMLKTIPQIEGIQKSADLNTAVLDHVAAHIHAGMSTAEIDKLVYDYTTEHGGIPAPLNYQGFPKSVCTSINNEICHGIPDENIILEEGDIINVDVSTILGGYFSDASRMFMIGKVSERAERLVRVTQECVELGLAQAKPWNHLGDIADAINTHILFVEANDNRYLLPFHHYQETIQKIKMWIRLLYRKYHKCLINICHSGPDEFILSR